MLLQIKVETETKGVCSTNYNCDPVTGNAWDIKALLEVSWKSVWGVLYSQTSIIRTQRNLSK